MEFLQSKLRVRDVFDGQIGFGSNLCVWMLFLAPLRAVDGHFRHSLSEMLPPALIPHDSWLSREFPYLHPATGLVPDKRRAVPKITKAYARSIQYSMVDELQINSYCGEFIQRLFAPHASFNDHQRPYGGKMNSSSALLTAFQEIHQTLSVPTEKRILVQLTVNIS